jgi:hypothetical protein
MVVLTAGFPRVFPEKRLELNSLKGRKKAEEEGPPRKTAEPRVHRGGTDPLLIAKQLAILKILNNLRHGVSNTMV